MDLQFRIELSSGVMGGLNHKLRQIGRLTHEAAPRVNFIVSALCDRKVTSSYLIPV